MQLNESMFREYDIRGVYGEDLSGEVAYNIGRAFGTKLREKNILSTVVGYDNRLSSVELEDNLVKGLIECGINVKRLGLVVDCFTAASFKTVCKS